MPDPLSTPDLLRVHPRDDVLVALRDVQPGETVRSMIATASGRPTCVERNGERELAIWKTGVTL
jgi:hypothetical protein